LISINKTFKSIEIIGQIIRNRHSSLKKDKLYEITDSAYGTGLRLVNFYIKLSDRFKEDIIRYIENILMQNPNIAEETLERKAKTEFLFITYNTLFSIMKKIATSVGSVDALEIYDKLSEHYGTPAHKLLKIAITLHFATNINMDELKALHEDLEDNIVAQRLFKDFVIEHLYLYKISSAERHKVASLFGIPILKQLQIEGTKQN